MVDNFTSQGEIVGICNNLNEDYGLGNRRLTYLGLAFLTKSKLNPHLALGLKVGYFRNHEFATTRKVKLAPTKSP